MFHFVSAREVAAVHMLHVFPLDQRFTWPLVQEYFRSC